MGMYYMLVLSQDGRLFAAGQNIVGNLGVGDKEPRKKMTLVDSLSGRTIIQVAVTTGPSPHV